MIHNNVAEEALLLSEMKQAVEKSSDCFLKLIYKTIKRENYKEYSDYFKNNVNANPIYYSVSLKKMINYWLPNDTIFISKTFSKNGKLTEKIFNNTFDDQAVQLCQKVLFNKLKTYEKNYYQKKLNNNKFLKGAVFGETLLSQITDSSFINLFSSMAFNLNYQTTNDHVAYFFKSNQDINPLKLEETEDKYRVDFVDLINHSLIYERENFINKFMKNKQKISEIVFSPSSNYSDDDQKAIDYLFTL